MPRIAHHPEQQSLPLFKPVHELDQSHGIVDYSLDDIRHHDIGQRLTLGRITRLYGELYGSTKGVNLDKDNLLEVKREDFYRARPDVLELGLYIAQNDEQYRAKDTQQLVRLRKDKYDRSPGVVFPEDEFMVITYSPSGMASRIMARTRLANRYQPDVNEKATRSACHALTEKIDRLSGLDNSLEELRTDILVPVQEEAYRNGNRGWQAHYSPKNIDRLRRQVDERYHEAIDIAAINLNVGSTALKAAHRAAASALYRTPDDRQRNQNWASTANFLRRYVQARRQKVSYAKRDCHVTLEDIEAHQVAA